MKKLLVLTAVAALVATTAVEARGGSRLCAEPNHGHQEEHDDHPVGALKFFGRRLLERRGRCCSWPMAGSAVYDALTDDKKEEVATPVQAPQPAPQVP